MKIEAIIFDWAGTTVDYGCFAPVQAFKDAFEQYGLNPSFDEIRKPMGMLKIEHIRTMLNMKTLHKQFLDKYQRDFTDEDIHKIYDIFEKSLMNGISQYTQLKPYVLETMELLRQKGIKIGSTTGYTDMMMAPVLKSAKEQGYQPDCWYSPDSTQHIGRPYPYMIFKNMQFLKLRSVQNIIKIGDTISDIEEGLNAGVFTVGVIEGSSMMGYSETEYQVLSESEKDELIQKTKKAYLDAGANETIMNLSEVEMLIKKCDQL